MTLPSISEIKTAYRETGIGVIAGESFNSSMTPFCACPLVVVIVYRERPYNLLSWAVDFSGIDMIYALANAFEVSESEAASFMRGFDHQGWVIPLAKWYLPGFINSNLAYAIGSLETYQAFLHGRRVRAALGLPVGETA